MALTAANFQTYVQENRLSARLYFFIHMVDAAASNFYWSDYHLQFDSYKPTNLTVSPVTYRASLYDGSYSISSVRVRIENMARYQTGNTTARFSANFATSDFETETCIIYLGYEGITAAGDFLTYYKGRMTNFSYSVTSLEFDVVDSALLDLPDVPQNRFARGAAYDAISEDLVDKPIPLVYGTWDSHTLYKYRDEVFIPAYMVDYNPDSSTPTIKLEVADHQIDDFTQSAMYVDSSTKQKIAIWDDQRELPGYIQDTFTEDLTNGRVTITLNSANAEAFMTAHYFIHPKPRTGDLEATDDTLNTNFQYDAGGASHTVSFPAMAPYDVTEMVARHSDSTGRLSQELEAWIEFAGYVSGSWSAGGIKLRIANSQSGHDVDLNTTDVTNLGTTARTTTSGFNWNSLDGNNTALVLTYNKHYDGSTDHIIQIQESGSSAVNVTPNEGYYYRMQDFAQEIERKLQDLTDNNANVSNTYHVTYMKDKNKFRIEATDASPTAYQVRTASHHTDIGFTANTATDTNAKESDDFTVLDVPDGDFSNLKLTISLTSTPSTTDFFLQAVWIKIVRKILSYNVRQTVKAQRINWGSFANLVGYHRAIPPKAPEETQRIIQDQRALSAVSNFIEGSSFFVTCAGREFGSWITGRGPASGDPINHAPYIIESLLRDEASVVTADIDTASFDAAYDVVKDSAAVATRTRHCLYVDTVTPMRSLIAALARFSRGFVVRSQDGQYRFAVVKGSYSATDWTIPYRDVATPLEQNFRISRVALNQVAQDIDFNFQVSFIKKKYNGFLNQTNTNTLNIQKKEIFCDYVVVQDNDDSKGYASNLLDYFVGDGSTVGQFGEPKTVIDVTLLDPVYHLVELGDIAQLHVDWDNHLKVFDGDSYADVYFLVTGKQYHRKEITLTLTEVYVTPP